MKYAAETGVYSLEKCLWEDMIFSKDNSPAIPYKEEYFRKFFDMTDDILLSNEPTQRIIGFHVHFPSDGKLLMDYGHWEVLLILMLFSLIGGKITDEKIRRQIREKCFLVDGRPRFDWQTLNNFYCSSLTEFQLEEFLQLPDEKLSALEKSLRPVVESAWEYTNCIDLSSDEKCIKVIEALLKNGYFMVVAAPDGDTSLQTAASMYGSFAKLLDTRIENLEEGWLIFKGENNGSIFN